MTEDAVFKSMQTPGHKYNVEVADKIVSPRITVCKIPAIVEAKGKPKEDTPGVGEYNPDKSFFETQVKGLEKKGVIISASQTKSITEIAIAKHKWVPGVGAYKNENCYLKLSNGPKATRMTRH